AGGGAHPRRPQRQARAAGAGDRTVRQGGGAMTTVAEPAAEPTPSAAQGVRAAAGDYVDRLRGGDVGSLPAVLGLVALIIVFTILRPHTFTNAFNFANLISQGAAVIVIAMGLVFVLLLGEIDLSAGFA